MIASLQNFFLVDEKARWHAILWSWLVGTGFGAIVSLSDASYTVLASASIGSSAIAFAFFIAAQMRSPRLERIRGRRSVLNFAYASVTVAVLAVFERFFDTPPAVYAAASEFANDIREGKMVSAAQALVIKEKARSILIDNKVQGSTRNRIVSAYAIAKAAAQYSTVRLDRAPHPSNATIVVSKQRTHIFFQPPAPMPVFVGSCHGGIASIDFTSRVDGSALLNVNAACRDTVVADSLIQNFTQTLDNIVWVDVVFEKCALVYNGGDLTLANVVFRDCKISISPTAPQGIREVLLRASTPITTTSEFPN